MNSKQDGSGWLLAVVAVVVVVMTVYIVWASGGAR